MIEQPYTSTSNIARRISVGKSAAKAQWKADKCCKHFSYRLMSKTGTKKPVLMTCVKSLATRFCRLKCSHADTGVNLKWFGHCQNDKCWVYGCGWRMADMTWETPLLRLQPVERQGTDTMAGGGKCDWLETGQMQTRADLWSVLRGRV